MVSYGWKLALISDLPGLEAVLFTAFNIGKG